MASWNDVINGSNQRANEEIDENSLETDSEPIEEFKKLNVSLPPEKKETSYKKESPPGPNAKKKKATFTGYPFNKMPPNFPNFMQQSRLPGGSIQAVQVGNVNNLQIGNNYSINYTNINGVNTKSTGAAPKPARETPKAKKVQVPIEILTSKVVVSEAKMDRVRNGDLGYKWKDFGRLLTLSNGALETVEYEYRHYGLNEIVFQVLIKWKEKLGKDATVGKLANVLDGIERGDLALLLLENDS